MEDKCKRILVIQSIIQMQSCVWKYTDRPGGFFGAHLTKSHFTVVGTDVQEGELAWHC